MFITGLAEMSAHGPNRHSFPHDQSTCLSCPSCISKAPTRLDQRVRSSMTRSPSPTGAGMSQVASHHINKITASAHSPGATVKVLFESQTEHEPCTLQFSPASREYLVIGTYSLDAPTALVRHGTLQLYHLHDDKLELVDTYVHVSAILDIRFNNPDRPEGEKFAVASSTGRVSIFKLEGTISAGTNGLKPKIVHLNTFQAFARSVIITSLAWHKGPNGPLAVSRSDGKISVLNFSADYAVLHSQQDINNHRGYESWVVAFAIEDAVFIQNDDTSNARIAAETLEDDDYDVSYEFEPPVSDGYGVYSGGDDSDLRLTHFFRDFEAETHQLQDSAKALSGHIAGVTAILPLAFRYPTGNKYRDPRGRGILLTGSYDDHVRLYVLPDWRHSLPNGFSFLAETPLLKARLSLGGGVWRLTWVSTEYRATNREECDSGEDCVITFRVLANCMQGGVRLLDVKGFHSGKWTIGVIAELRFNTSNDLAYAGDVQPATGPNRVSDLFLEGQHDDGQEYVFVSANFYEKTLCVWKYVKPATLLSFAPDEEATGADM